MTTIVQLLDDFVTESGSVLARAILTHNKFLCSEALLLQGGLHGGSVAMATAVDSEGGLFSVLTLPEQDSLKVAPEHKPEFVKKKLLDLITPLLVQFRRKRFPLTSPPAPETVVPVEEV